MQCHACNRELSDPANSPSIVIVLQKVEPSGYTFYQCDDGQEFQYLTLQHFHCSQRCLRSGVEKCLTEHYDEEKLHPIPVGEGRTVLHKIVAANVHNCVWCKKPLNGVAYRFLLTHATPINRTIHTHYETIGWCCSLSCARARALELLWRKAISTEDHG